jgi:hypothetical protein
MDSMMVREKPIILGVSSQQRQAFLRLLPFYRPGLAILRPFPAN